VPDKETGNFPEMIKPLFFLLTVISIGLFLIVTLMLSGNVEDEATKENSDCGKTSDKLEGVNWENLGFLQAFLLLLLLPYAAA
jgi:hypothetical protein